MYSLTYAVGGKQFTMIAPTKGLLMVGLAEVESFARVDAWRVRDRDGWCDGSPEAWKVIQDESQYMQIIWG